MMTLLPAKFARSVAIDGVDGRDHDHDDHDDDDDHDYCAASQDCQVC